jgi:hypothetical protein
MVATKLQQLGALAVWLLVVPPGAWAATTNATVTNANVQLHDSYPTFSATTLWQFQLNRGRVLRNIPKDARIEVTAKKTVKTQEWFAVTYVVGENTFKGWVYAGEVGDRRYVRLDRGVEERVPVAARGREWAPAGATADALLEFILPSVQAQAVETVVPPPVATSPFATLLLHLAYVAIFLGALAITKKFIFKNSNKYCLLIAFCILLIFGLLSQTTFADIIAKFIA